MAAFLPTTELLRLIAEALDREPDDPAVSAPFDRLVVRGQLVPWLPDWWELIGWESIKVEKLLKVSGIST